jgi:hypothetical protein
MYRNSEFNPKRFRVKIKCAKYLEYRDAPIFRQGKNKTMLFGPPRFGSVIIRTDPDPFIIKQKINIKNLISTIL